MLVVIVKQRCQMQKCLAVNFMSDEKKMLLYLKTERPSGRMGKATFICHTDKDGVLLMVTARSILRWINEQLKMCDAEEGGITDYGRPADNEFKPYHSWRVGSKDDE